MKKNAKTTADDRNSLGPTNLLDDLLFRVRAHLITEGDLNHQQVIKRMGDLGWTANVIARSLGKPRNRVRLSQLVVGEARFKKHLNQFPQISPRRMAMLNCHRTRLVRYAREFGVANEAFEISDEWDEILTVVSNVLSAPTIVKAAIQIGRRPSEFSDADLSTWGEEQKRKNGSYVYVQMAQSRFRAAIRGSSLEGKLPLLNCNRRNRSPYRIKIASLPSKLRKELKGVLKCVTKHRRERARMSH
jgi:hypothetical protein